MGKYLIAAFMIFTMVTHAKSLVIRGGEISENIYPQVMLGPTECTSTLIGPRVLITSAHCVINASREYIKNLNQYAVFFTHPKFTTSKYVESYDVAVGILESEVTGIQPMTICENERSQTSYLGRKLSLIGYGCTTIDTRNGVGIKRYGNSIISKIEKDFIETDAGTSGGLSCQGDSGGPYLFIDSLRKSTCVLSINFFSMDNKNMSTNVFYSVIAIWLRETEVPQV